MPSLDLPPARWRDEVRRIEDLGFATVAVSEHVAHGWAMDPLAVMAAAAAATERLRVLSLVLSTTFAIRPCSIGPWRPIDRLSDGRLEVGIGAGWQAADYEAFGWPFDPPSVRIERLAESLEIVERLFGGEEVNFAGRTTRCASSAACHEPSSNRDRRCSWVAAAGGSWSSRHAWPTSSAVHATLSGASWPPIRSADFGADRIASKVEWINAALAAAGRPADARRIAVQRLPVPDRWSRGVPVDAVSTFADRLAVDPELVAQSPSVLIGSVHDCADQLEERRERYGFSYLRLSDEHR